MERGRGGAIPADVDDNNFEKGNGEGNNGGKEEEIGPQVRQEPTKSLAKHGRG